MSAYLTLQEAQEYYDGRLYTDAWDCATEINRNKALTMASRAIDRLNYHGIKADEAQTLQFPRSTDSVVPEDIKSASAEEALALLDGKDPELERESLSVVEQSFGGVKAKYDRASARPINIVHGIMSATAWGYILPYLRSPLTMRISRTS